MNDIPVLDFAHLPWPVEIPTHMVFDVDGTLTDHHSVTSEDTIAALRRLHDAGIPITLATGRILPAGQAILDRAGVPGWVVGGAGGTVSNGHELVSVHTLPPELIERALGRGRKLGLSCYFYLAEDIVIDEEAPHSPELLLNANEGRPIHRADLDTLDWSEVTKVTFSSDAHTIDRVLPGLAEEFDGLVRGHPLFLDLPLPGITKWEGITEALAAQGLDASTGIGIGDSGNDVPWLPHIGYPIAAPDSPPEVLAVVDYRLPDVENPVAKLIEAILWNR